MPGICVLPQKRRSPPFAASRLCVKLFFSRKDAKTQNAMCFSFAASRLRVKLFFSSQRLCVKLFFSRKAAKTQNAICFSFAALREIIFLQRGGNLTKISTPPTAYSAARGGNHFLHGHNFFLFDLQQVFHFAGILIGHLLDFLLFSLAKILGQTILDSFLE